MSSLMEWYLLQDTGKLSTLAHQSCPDLLCVLSPNTRGLAYGDGFFTTMGVYQGKILWIEYHKDRVSHHLSALFLHLPNPLQSKLWDCVVDQATTIDHGIIKLMVTRHPQELRGYAYSPQLAKNSCQVLIGIVPSSPSAQQTADFLVADASTQAHPALTDHTIKDDTLKNCAVLRQSPIVATCLNAQLALLPPALAGVKSLNRLDSVLIAGELEQRKLTRPELAEGLVQDMTGTWVEGVMGNVFYQLQGSNQWYTPPLEASGIKGVMREVIMDKLLYLRTPAIERRLEDVDLPNLQALFFCNAVRGVIPVKTLLLSSGAMTLSLKYR